MDLIKAFDSVPLDGLYIVLEKLGYPPKFRRMVQAFHSDLSVKISINGSDVTVNSTTGVKQGCTLAPILFRVYIEAVDEIIRARLESADIKHVPFYTLNDFTMAGRKSSQPGAPFTMNLLFFADDGYFHFESLQDLLN